MAPTSYYNYIYSSDSTTAGASTWNGYQTASTSYYYPTTTSSSTADTSSGWVYIQTGDLINIKWNDATYHPSQPETEEQLKAREKRQEEYDRIRLESQRKMEAEEAERKNAVKKAEELLKEHIGLQRFGLLYQVGHLEVDSQKYAGRKYRVSKNAYERIKVLEGDKVVDELCLVPTVECPDGDKLLTKIVLLECNEDLVLSKANHTRRN